MPVKLLTNHSIKINTTGRSIMYLSQLKLKELLKVAIQACLYTMILALASCVMAPIQQAARQSSISPKKITAVGQTLERNINIKTSYLTSNLVHYILMEEIAEQRDNVKFALNRYHEHEIEIESPILARYKTQIAIIAQDTKRIALALDQWLKIDSWDAGIYVIKMIISLLEEDYGGVIRAIDAALLLEPKNVQSMLSRITEQITKRLTYVEALNIFQQLKRFENKNPDILLAYGKLTVFYEHYVNALKSLDNALEQQPQFANALVMKAGILKHIGKINSALALLSEAIHTWDDGSNTLLFIYAKFLGENGHIQRSRQIFQRLYDDQPDNMVILALGLLALEDKDGGMAEGYLSKLIKPNDLGIQVKYLIDSSGNLDANLKTASAWSTSVPIKNSRYQSTQTHYINILAKLGEIGKARNHLKLLQDNTPDKIAQHFLFEGSLLQKESYDFAAFNIYVKAIPKIDGNIKLFYDQAMISKSLNRLYILEKNLHMILKIEPDYDQALNALGYILSNHTNRHQEALRLIRKAVYLKPNNPFYQDSLGCINSRLGNLKIGEHYFRQAIAIQPSLEILEHLGEVLWLLGEKLEAKHVWKQGLQQAKKIYYH